MTGHNRGVQISVMLAVPDAPAASAWYQRALGGCSRSVYVRCTQVSPKVHTSPSTREAAVRQRGLN